MSFLDRYEFEQVVDRDLAIARYGRQETINERQQLASTPKIKLSIWRTVLIGLTAAGLGITLHHQPSFAQHSQQKSEGVTLVTQQK